MDEGRSNPYQNLIDVPAEPRVRTRPFYVQALRALHVVGYVGYAVWWAVLLVATLTLGGLDSARLDEIILVVLFVTAGPFVIWFLALELGNVPNSRRDNERFLARVGLAFCLVPLTYAAFSASEFVRFGGWKSNGAPAAIATVLGIGWLCGGLVRLRFAPSAVASEYKPES